MFYIICNIPVINDSSDLIDLTLPLVGVPEGFLKYKLYLYLLGYPFVSSDFVNMTINRIVWRI